MLDLSKLEAERKKATQDKCDLFDFYNDNWDSLVSEIEKLVRKNKDLETYKNECLMKPDRILGL